MLADHAAKEGVNAFCKLQNHWENRDFDILIVCDGDRFARTQALHAYITERTIAIGARIYSIHDGWIDDTNYRLWIAMSGYKSAGDTDRLINQQDSAMTGRAKRGLPVSSRIPDASTQTRYICEVIYGHRREIRYFSLTTDPVTLLPATTVY